MYKNNYWLDISGLAVILVVMATLFFTGWGDFTSPFVDWVAREIASDPNHAAPPDEGGLVLWLGFFFLVVIEKWLLSPSWWIVLLGAAALFVMFIGMLELILNKDLFDDITDDASHAAHVGLQWVRFYFPAAGIFMAFTVCKDMWWINFLLIAVPLPLIFASLWGTEVNLLKAVWVWLIGVFMAVVATCTSLIAVVVLLWGLFKLISAGPGLIPSAGSVRGTVGGQNIVDINGNIATTADGHKHMIDPSGTKARQIN